VSGCYRKVQIVLSLRLRKVTIPREVWGTRQLESGVKLVLNSGWKGLLAERQGGENLITLNVLNLPREPR
jgi:hypothetical protein